MMPRLVLVLAAVLSFEPRFPTAPDPGSWANPYVAVDRRTGREVELKPRLPDIGASSPEPGEPFAPGSIENPWQVGPDDAREGDQPSSQTIR
jgi:hypothetical protein